MEAPSTLTTSKPSSNPAAKYLSDDWEQQTASLTLEQWKSDGVQFGRAYRSVLLGLARWLVKGERAWGHTYEEAEVYTGLSYSRLSKLARVGNLLAILPIRQKLHVSHYEALLDDGLQDEDRRLLLDRAETEKLTAVAFGKVVKEYKKQLALPDPPQPAWNGGNGGKFGDAADEVEKHAKTAQEYGEIIAAQLPKHETEGAEPDYDAPDLFEQPDAPIAYAVVLEPVVWAKAEEIAAEKGVSVSEVVNAVLVIRWAL